MVEPDKPVATCTVVKWFKVVIREYGIAFSPERSRLPAFRFLITHLLILKPIIQDYKKDTVHANYNVDKLPVGY